LKDILHLQSKPHSANQPPSHQQAKKMPPIQYFTTKPYNAQLTLQQKANAILKMKKA